LKKDGIKILMAQDASKYSKSELRENIKDRVMAGSKGGKPGQWSARKAQLVAQQYEKAGGGYKGGKGEETERSRVSGGKRSGLPKMSTKNEPRLSLRLKSIRSQSDETCR
jgi:hypothetical protein